MTSPKLHNKRRLPDNRWSRSDVISALALVGAVIATICSIALPIHLDNERKSEEINGLRFNTRLQEDGSLRIWQQSGQYFQPERFTLQPSYYLVNGALKEGLAVPITLSNYAVLPGPKAEYRIPNVMVIACDREPDASQCKRQKFSIQIKYEVRGDGRLDYVFY